MSEHMEAIERQQESNAGICGLIFFICLVIGFSCPGCGSLILIGLCFLAAAGEGTIPGGPSTAYRVAKFFIGLGSLIIGFLLMRFC